MPLQVIICERFVVANRNTNYNLKKADNSNNACSSLNNSSALPALTLDSSISSTTKLN